MPSSKIALPSWPRWRLRFLLNNSKTSERIKRLRRASEFSFVPMEAIGEKGELDLSTVIKRDNIGSGYTLFFENDVLVAKITPCFENGKGALAKNLKNGIGYGTTEIYILSPNSKLIPQFLFYLTGSHEFRTYGEASMKGAAGQKRVPDSFLKNYELSLPPRNAQRRIANYLDHETARIDELVTEKKRMISLLEEKRAALISRAVTQGLNPDAPLKPSGAPWFDKMPENWSTKRLKWIITSVTSGVSVNASDRPAGHHEFGVMKTSSILAGHFFPNKNKTVWVNELERLACPVTANSIVMSRMNTPALVGESGYVDQNYPNLFLPDRLWKIEFDKKHVHVPFLALLLSSKKAREALSSVATGTSPSMKNLTIEEMSNLLIPLPPINEQISIYKKLAKHNNNISQIKEQISQSIHLLTERRAALVTAAITGQITQEEMAT